MPIYEYQCTSCGHRFERLQRVSDPPETVCASCGGPVTKLISTPAIQFKGSGFYITDYVKSGQTTKDGKEGSGTAPEAGGKDAGGSSSTAGATPAKTEQGAAKPAKADTSSKPSPVKTSD